MYEYTELWVWFKEEDGLPGAKERLLVRRGTGQEPDLKYHRSNAPPEIPLSKLAQVRGTRWSIEEDIQTGKGECGLDEYETRGWEGWHHHTALSILAQAFLVLQKLRLGGKEAGMTVPEVRELLSHLLEVREWNMEELLKWSRWRRERNRRAAASHCKRRLAEMKARESRNQTAAL